MFGPFFLADVSCKNNYLLLVKTLSLPSQSLFFQCHYLRYWREQNRYLLGCITKSSWVIAFPGENVVYFCANSKPILCLMLYAGCVVAKIYVWYSVRMQWVMLMKSKTRFFLELVITKGYGMRATTIEGQNAFAPSLCFTQISR